MITAYAGKIAPGLAAFANEVQVLVNRGGVEYEIARQVATRLRILLASGLVLPPEVTCADPDHYVIYPLHVAEDRSFSIAAAVWDVGQSTPVHRHETWGVVGIYSGVEHEVRYVKPVVENIPLVSNGEHSWEPGRVTICCTTDDDVHQVSCESSQPCIGIHVYGSDIGTLRRRWYDPDSGKVEWFVSSWAQPRVSTVKG